MFRNLMKFGLEFKIDSFLGMVMLIASVFGLVAGDIRDVRHGQNGPPQLQQTHNANNTITPVPVPVPVPSTTSNIHSNGNSTTVTTTNTNHGIKSNDNLNETVINKNKFVFAHFMVGNTYPYTKDDWTRDIILASSKGLDGFALNIGPENWMIQKVEDAYNAAAQLTNSTGIQFKFFFSFDMGSIPCEKESDGVVIKEFVEKYKNHRNQVRFKGRVLVSTFGGAHCRFGKMSMDDGWKDVLKSKVRIGSGGVGIDQVDIGNGDRNGNETVGVVMVGNGNVNDNGIGSGMLREETVEEPPVFLITAFFDDPGLYGGYKTPDGAFAWDSAWPMGNSNISTSYDRKYRDSLGGRAYMAAVSPWFFTHYGADTYDKNFIYRGDDHLFATRWDILVAQRDTIDLVEVISWNDYGESHYLGPITGAQPGSNAWTDGFDHTGWLDMMQYYIAAFKTGIYPTILKDRVFIWGRLYPANADVPDDPIGKPRNWEFTQDRAWAVLFLTAQSQITFSCGLSTLSVNLPAGVSKISLGLKEECVVTLVVARLNTVVVNFSPKGYVFMKNPKTYNFNAFVAASPA